MPAVIWAAGSQCDNVSGFFNQTVSGCTGSIFKSVPNDLSLEYLRLIFGSVSTSLQGSSNQLVGEMFRIFNLGILIITTTLISYTAFSSVMGSAQEGSSMGPKVSPFVMVRIVGGTSLLLPSFNGYSGIQVMVMYAVVQGVGFANSAWTTAVDYIEQTGMSINQRADSNAYTNQKKFLSIGTQMSQSAVCLQSYKLMCEQTGVCKGFAANDKRDAFTKASLYKVQGYFNQGGPFGSINFGTDTSKSMCGSYSIDGAPTNVSGSNSMLYFTALNIANALNTEARSWVTKLYESSVRSGNNRPDPSIYQCASTTSCPFFSAGLISAASSYVGVLNIVSIENSNIEQENTSKMTWTKNAKERGWITAGMYYRNLITGGSSAGARAMSSEGAAANAPMYLNRSTRISDEYALNLPFTTLYSDFNSALGSIKNAAVNQINELQDASNVYQSGGQANAQFTYLKGTIRNKMKAMANGYTYKKNISLSGVGDTAGANFGMNQEAMLVPLQNLVAVILGMMEQIMGFTYIQGGVDAQSLACTFQYDGKTAHSRHLHSPACESHASISDTCSGDSCYLPYGLLGGIYYESLGETTDPLLGVTAAGQKMMALAVGYWYQTTQFLYKTIISASMKLFFGSMAIQLPMTAAAAALYGEAPFAASALAATAQLAVSIMKLYFDIGKVGMEIYVPLGSAIAAVVFGLGILMGVYIPFLPFLLFLFGAIGWIMAVIEAMVAAPLVALGVTHPEGHDLLGKAEQSLMLLLGVFVRPITMILGLFFAIQLSTVVVKLFNRGFLFVATNFITQFDSIGGDAGYAMIMQDIGFVGLVMVYAYVLMTILEQVYALIYQIPDKILRWIGGPQDSAGSVSQMVNQIKSQISGMGQSIGQAGSGVTKGPAISGETAKGVDWKKDDGGSGGQTSGH